MPHAVPRMPHAVPRYCEDRRCKVLHRLACQGGTALKKESTTCTIVQSNRGCHARVRIVKLLLTATIYTVVATRTAVRYPLES